MSYIRTNIQEQFNLQECTDYSDLQAENQKLKKEIKSYEDDVTVLRKDSEKYKKKYVSKIRNVQSFCRNVKFCCEIEIS